MLVYFHLCCRCCYTLLPLYRFSLSFRLAVVLVQVLTPCHMTDDAATRHAVQLLECAIPPLCFFRVTSPLSPSVFLKHGQLDVYKAADCIFDYLTLSNFLIFQILENLFSRVFGFSIICQIFYKLSDVTKFSDF